jgi:hypothetical protein
MYRSVAAIFPAIVMAAVLLPTTVESAWSTSHSFHFAEKSIGTVDAYAWPKGNSPLYATRHSTLWSVDAPDFVVGNYD